MVACTAELFHTLLLKAPLLIKSRQGMLLLELVTQFPFENLMPLVRSPETVDARPLLFDSAHLKLWISVERSY